MNGITIYDTSLYADETKSIDYFIKTNSEKLGKVVYYFDHEAENTYFYSKYTKDHSKIITGQRFIALVDMKSTSVVK